MRRLVLGCAMAAGCFSEDSGPTTTMTSNAATSEAATSDGGSTTTASTADGGSGSGDTSTGPTQSCADCLHGLVLGDGACGGQYQQCDQPSSGCVEIADCWIAGGLQCCDAGRPSAELAALAMCLRDHCGPECADAPALECEAGSEACKSCITASESGACMGVFVECSECLDALACFDNVGAGCCEQLMDPTAVDQFLACARDIGGCGASCTDPWMCP